MAMAHLKIDNQTKFEFEQNDEVLIFTVTKDGDKLNDEFGLTAGIIERVDSKGRIVSLSVIPHSVKDKLFTSEEKHMQIPVNKLRVKFSEWFACSVGDFNGKVLPLYKVENSKFYVLIKNVLRPVGKM